MAQVSQLVQEALTRKSADQTKTSAKRWSAVLFLFVAILFHLLKEENECGKSSRKTWWWTGLFLCVAAFVVLLKLIMSYIASYLKLSPIEVTDKQRSLLAIGETDLGFKPATPKKASSTPVVDKSISLSSLFGATLRTPTPMSPPGAVTPVNLTGGSWGNLSSRSLSPSLQTPGSSPTSPAINFSMSGSSSGSVTANSWAFHRNQSSILDSSYNVLASPQHHMFSPSQLSDSLVGNRLGGGASSPPSPSMYGPPITDNAELQEYLQQYKEKEKLRQIMSQSESSNGMNSSLWAYGGSPLSQLSDYSNLLRKNIYQTATKDTGLETNSTDSKNDDSKASTLCSSSVSKIWRKRNVTPEELFQFTENLRIWMSANLLVPLVKDIDSTNKALSAAAPEIQIGCVGVDKLKKTAQNISGVKQLSDLIPFLDMTIHQDYLVHRLRELSAGGAISAYRWNGGSSNFNGKPWKDEYPTDTAILLHVFAMYMDRQLPPDIQQPEGRMFSSTHLIKAPEKPAKPTTRPLLYLTQVNPPHLKVVLPPDEECEVGSGRNNFIHALLLFIHHVTHQQHSRIANINLTMSGVNLTWVVRKS
ncbi:transmembrane protein 209-like [Penaeus monodon]|uniref:transmembrane protein 209-like n=1 Tax=Penaeus monodon TaxID=6687 RepID=UPI0018A6DB01|nr:transmembrane protein 209-like [Penaeus monodon]XP_037775275.1 transmembrane protein 209-like [Penaeus monodon]XP_037775276.1 transmembrane protein 209-like [Penaeus monodon]XP_037775277.1 transmembrane protein 209-like [Penaeus monodon]XP_037775278.1 transmembrane protein 209-like [Penaeus monodon]XP_037775279.1 transmembrane protein 209-like [Penaeus monodon]